MYAGTEIAISGLTRTGALTIQIGQFVSRFLFLPVEARIIVPVWILHTWIFDLFRFTPYLRGQSPEAGSGKSTLGDVLSATCCRATSPMCGSAAALRRIFASEKPSLIVDEWDSLDGSIRKACIVILNTGYRSDGTYALVESKAVIKFPTFCPKAILGKADVILPDATLQRCIPIKLNRALAEDKIEKWNTMHEREADPIRDECQAWAEEFRARKTLVDPSAFDPTFYDSLTGRQQDICEPLLTIADAGGGPIPETLRRALQKVFSRPEIRPETELLRALRTYAEQQHENYILGAEFCAWANTQPDQPWLAKNETRLTQARLAEILKAYDIHPVQINRLVRRKQINRRGYFLSQFADAWRRYT
jgi:hypothetical protein